MVSVSVLYLFYQLMDEKIKHGLFVIPQKKTLIWKRHCSIGQLCCKYDVKAKYRLILCSRKFSGNQPKSVPFSMRSMNQSNRSLEFGFVRAFSFKVMRKSLYRTIRSASGQDNHHLHARDFSICSAGKHFSVLAK